MADREQTQLVRRVRLGVLVAYAVLVAHFIWTFSSDQTRRAITNEHSKQYAAEAQQRITQACVDGARFAECATIIMETTREAQHAEQDLEAQQETAEWTRLMAILSAVAVLMSGFGLWALWRTLKQGQRANAISQLAIEADNRPWIEIVITKKALVISDIGTRFVGECKLINRGKSPAIGVLPYPALTAVPGVGELNNTALPRAKAVVDHWNTRDPGYGFSIFPGGELDHHLLPIVLPQEVEQALGGRSGFTTFFLAVVARYGFGDKIGETAVTFRLSFRPMKVDLDDGPRDVDDADLALEDTHQGYAT